MQTLRLTGRVVQGTGEGAKFLGLEWVKKQIREELGFKPFQGTLNIKLDSSIIESWSHLMTVQGMEIVPARDFSRGKMFTANIKGIACGIVVPLVARYPRDLVEVVASFNLREKLGLVDGDAVEVEVRI